MPIPTGPQDSGRFDFIMGGSTPHASGIGGGSSAKTRVAVAGGGFAVIAILAWVFISFLTRPAGIDTGTLIAIAQKQTELARISQTPALDASQQATQNFAETTYLALLTAQLQFVSYLQKHSATKVDSRTLSASKSAQTDTQLTNAKTTGTYDTAYIAIAQSQLAAYGQALAQAYAASKSTSERQLLKNAYDQTQLLSTMSRQSY